MKNHNKVEKIKFEEIYNFQFRQELIDQRQLTFEENKNQNKNIDQV